MCQMDQKQSVAALALFNTDFVGIENAMMWIYDEEDEGFARMQHPFVASLPASEPFTTVYVQYLGQDDLENDMTQAHLICYICGYEKERHHEKHQQEQESEE